MLELGPTQVSPIYPVSGKENRAHPRYALRWAVTILIGSNGVGTSIEGYTHELSSHGCSILTERNCFTPEPIKLLLSMPPASPQRGFQPLEMTARMKYTLHSHKHGCFRIGIQFATMADEVRHALEQRLEIHAPLGAPKAA